MNNKHYLVQIGTGLTTKGDFEGFFIISKRDQESRSLLYMRKDGTWNFGAHNGDHVNHSYYHSRLQAATAFTHYFPELNLTELTHKEFCDLSEALRKGADKNG